MKIFPTVFTTLLLLYSFVGLKAQMVTYSGPVDYYLEITKVANGGGTNDGYDWNVSVDEKH